MAGLFTSVADGIKTRLETISGLRVYEFPPDAINEYPAAVINRSSEAGYLVTYTAIVEVEQKVTVYVKSADAEERMESLESFLAPTGSSSVKAAIDGDNTLGSVVDWCVLEDAETLDPTDLPGVSAAEFRLRWSK